MSMTVQRRHQDTVHHEVHTLAQLRNVHHGHVMVESMLSVCEMAKHGNLPAVGEQDVLRGR